MPDTTPLAPMTPHEAISALSYLRAVQADDAVAAREFAGAEPRMPELLDDAAERIDFTQQFLTEDHEGARRPDRPAARGAGPGPKTDGGWPEAARAAGT
ncbi:hypothetical protein [Streptomyces thermolilacinus]|uniref:hypothetical protein n=1 Tax=Streptomyces thermolilacinus TaxID=285540 RepID=UPI0033C1CE9B